VLKRARLVDRLKACGQVTVYWALGFRVSYGELVWTGDYVRLFIVNELIDGFKEEMDSFTMKP